MEWYEVILGVVMFVVGTFIRIKVKKINRDSYYNGSWRGKRKL